MKQIECNCRKRKNVILQRGRNYANESGRFRRVCLDFWSNFRNHCKHASCLDVKIIPIVIARSSSIVEHDDDNNNRKTCSLSLIFVPPTSPIVLSSESMVPEKAAPRCDCNNKKWRNKICQVNYFFFSVHFKVESHFELISTRVYESCELFQQFAFAGSSKSRKKDINLESISSGHIWLLIKLDRASMVVNICALIVDGLLS